MLENAVGLENVCRLSTYIYHAKNTGTLYNVHIFSHRFSVSQTTSSFRSFMSKQRKACSAETLLNEHVACLTEQLQSKC